jgi:UDP-N-acetylglucosamine 2-epimerase (non-hydrolysing)/GDP/UDP-N,N'-diacetylbacillosamine 2-epimerase (hydrolysing)
MIVNKRKICVVTGTRAEYGLLYWTMKRIQDEQNLELQVIATGMHCLQSLETLIISLKMMDLI